MHKLLHCVVLVCIVVIVGIYVLGTVLSLSRTWYIFHYLVFLVRKAANSIYKRLAP